MADRAVTADRKVLYDSQGNRYVATFTGAWDPPLDDERVGCYYEDDDRPTGVVKLFRLTKVKDRAANVFTDEGGRRGREIADEL